MLVDPGYREPGDLPLAEIIEMVEAILSEDPDALCFLKWTCPKCGERCTVTEPNTAYTEGVKHEEDGCDYIYTGDYWGLMVIYSSRSLFDDE